MNTTTLYPRRALKGAFATPVRSDGWRESDEAGQRSAQELATLGATGIWVNWAGVAYGVIDGVRVLLSSASPARYIAEREHDWGTSTERVAADEDWTLALVTRVEWTMSTGNWKRVAR